MTAFLLLAMASITLAAASPAATTAPEVFAPGVVSGPINDDAPAFTPDGATVFFGASARPLSTILVSHRQGGAWSKPEVASFSGEWSDQQVTMAPDGAFLVFVSNRPLVAGDKSHPSGNLWRVDRIGAGWGQPVHLPAAVNRDASIWAPSIAGDGSLYFIDREKAGAPFRLWRSQWRGGTYEAATAVSFGDPSTQDVDPAVAPDESFIVFASTRPGSDKPERLFIAHREGDHWGRPFDLGDKVNGAGDTNGARLGPDHRTLYFTSDRTTPAHLPRTQTQAEQDLARARSWDNGLTNIWRVSLAPWLDAGPNG